MMGTFAVAGFRTAIGSYIYHAVVTRGAELIPGAGLCAQTNLNADRADQADETG